MLLNLFGGNGDKNTVYNLIISLLSQATCYLLRIGNAYQVQHLEHSVAHTASAAALFSSTLTPMKSDEEDLCIPVFLTVSKVSEDAPPSRKPSCWRRQHFKGLYTQIMLQKYKRSAPLGHMVLKINK